MDRSEAAPDPDEPTQGCRFNSSRTYLSHRRGLSLRWPLRPPPTGAATEVSIDGARRLFRASEEAEAAQQRDRYLDQLKAYLAFVEERRSELVPNATEIAHQLDGTAMAFYRLSQNELAGRSVDVGLSFAPAQPTLLHHKALILLAANRDVAQVLPLLEEAVKADPNDKSIWATLGDALKLWVEPADATEAYLKAQELDPTSTQYVEKALRVSPGHAEPNGCASSWRRRTEGPRRPSRRAKPCSPHHPTIRSCCSPGSTCSPNSARSGPRSTRSPQLEPLDRAIRDWR